MTWIGRSASGLTECQPSPTLSQEVCALLQRLRPSIEDERRSVSRVPISMLFRLSPTPGSASNKADEEMVVVGKEISERGIGFFHERPITYRRGLLTIDSPEDGPIQLEVKLLWCRFTSVGWYESGGLLQRVTSGDLHPAPHPT